MRECVFLFNLDAIVQDKTAKKILVYWSLSTIMRNTVILSKIA